MGDGKIPQSMVAELAGWNNGNGIDLASWVGCEGNFRHAIGYTQVFWPQFIMHKGYVFKTLSTLEALDTSLLGIEENCQSRAEIEWVMNHIHIRDIQHYGC